RVERDGDVPIDHLAAPVEQAAHTRHERRLRIERDERFERLDHSLADTDLICFTRRQRLQLAAPVVARSRAPPRTGDGPASRGAWRKARCALLPRLTEEEKVRRER